MHLHAMALGCFFLSAFCDFAFNQGAFCLRGPANAAALIGFVFFGVAVASVMGLSELARDIAFIGTVRGMIWGGTAGFIVFGLCIRNWYTAAAVESYEERLSCSETAN